MSKPDMWAIENGFFEKGIQVICGVDEAGRGPLAGPVCAAAVILPRGLELPWLNDSKQVTEKRRDILFDQIKAQAVAWSVASVSASEIDELDILSLEKGQMAKVNIDAIDGQDFEGVISSISNKASGGGNGEAAKYKVRIRVDRADGMMNGMNASAEINVGDRKGALTIPVEAVQSLDEKNIVYTALDEAGMPSEPKEVRLGFSTSTEVEILSGLQEGDMVYYLPTTEDQDEGGYYYF